MLGAAVRRARALLGEGRTLIVTAADQEQQIRARAPRPARGGHHRRAQPRNTAPGGRPGRRAVACRRADRTPLAVLPADPLHRRRARVRARLRATTPGHAGPRIVTIGIAPTHAETGFGYIRLGARAEDGADGAAFTRSTRSSRSRTARWPRATSPRELPVELGHVLPQRRAGCSRRRAATCPRSPWCWTPPWAHPATPPRPPSCAALRARDEHLDRQRHHGEGVGLRVVPGDFGWSDVGSWTAVADIRPADAAGNVDPRRRDREAAAAASSSPTRRAVRRRRGRHRPRRRGDGGRHPRHPEVPRAGREEDVEAAKKSGRGICLTDPGLLNGAPLMNPRVFREYDIRGHAEEDFPSDFVDRSR